MEYTPVPSPLLGPLLEEIEHLDELKVTLRVVWLLHRKKGGFRWMTQQDLQADAVLSRVFAGRPNALAQALEAATKRGTLVAVGRPGGGTQYTLNTADNWRAASRSIDPDAQTVEFESEGTGPGGVGRSTIFKLYEDNIGMLSPLLAEQLKDAEQRYPERWILDAFMEALAQNKRSWRYIQRILERWEREGRGDAGTGRYPEKGGPIEGRRQAGNRPFRY
jgi:DnaD/phage-associated family protein